MPLEKPLAIALVLAAVVGCGRREAHHDRAHGEHDRAQDEHGDAAEAEEFGPMPPSRHLGEMMAEVGRRLERAGRAVDANRWELAAYDVGELEEVFEGEVAVVVTPEDVPLDVGKVAAQFARTQLPALERAIASRDRATFERAFAQTTDACNACHRAANHGYIEVPSVIGEAIPRLSRADAGAAPTPAP